MADKAISQLNAAGQITATDLFVLQQNNEAKSLQGQVLLNWLTAAADGHGGISSITKTGTSGLVDTYRITLADTTTYDFTVTNGAKGDKGNTGQAWYMHIRYADHEPTQDSDMSTVANDWIGIYSGTSATAPTAYTAYTWYKIKGNKGDKGDTGTSLTTYEVTYQASISGTVIPSGIWTVSIPSVSQGQYLWTRTVTNFSDEREAVTAYSVARFGIDGSGSVSQVNSQSPDVDGNVELTGESINITGTDDRSLYEVVNGIYDRFEGMNYPVSFTNLTFTNTSGSWNARVEDEFVTADMTPGRLAMTDRRAINGDLTITAQDGYVLFTMSGAPSVAFSGEILLHTVGDGSEGGDSRPESVETATVAETLSYLGITTEGGE